jgi:aspartyl-tRNA(Asn)/glutamyl-tRNA(Gln) amidotransferase subunit B
MRARLVAAHGIADQDAAQLTSSRELAAYYEQAAALAAADDAAARKRVAHWVLGEFSAALNRAEIGVTDAPVQPRDLAGLLRRVDDGTLSGTMAKDVFDAMWAGEGDADRIIERRGLRQMSDDASIAALVDGVLAAHPAIVAEFRAGKEKAFNALVGHVMKASKGKANPAQVNATLRRKLG